MKLDVLLATSVLGFGSPDLHSNGPIPTSYNMHTTLGLQVSLCLDKAVASLLIE